MVTPRSLGTPNPSTLYVRQCLGEAPDLFSEGLTLGVPDNMSLLVLCKLQQLHPEYCLGFSANRCAPSVIARYVVEEYSCDQSRMGSTIAGACKPATCPNLTPGTTPIL